MILNLLPNITDNGTIGTTAIHSQSRYSFNTICIKVNQVQKKKEKTLSPWKSTQTLIFRLCKALVLCHVDTKNRRLPLLIPRV